MAKGDFGNKRNTSGFDKNPNNAGRKKKIYTILKETGYGADDIRTAFGEVAFYTLEELKQVRNNESLPIITRIIANQFQLALTKNDWGKVKEILEQVVGKPKQTVDTNITENFDRLQIEVIKNDKKV